MKKELLIQIKSLKDELQQEGFIIDGIFGSAIKRDDFNDIDLLYHLKEEFFSKNIGFKGFKKLEEIKVYLQSRLGKEIDLASIDNLSNTAKKYILKEVIKVR
jgi:predicted nucleotidyltransferase